MIEEKTKLSLFVLLLGLSQNCFAENSTLVEGNILVGCSSSLTFTVTGVEDSCVLQYYLNPYFALGVRYSNRDGKYEYANTGLAIVSWRPMAGSFYAEGGIGLSRYHANGSSDDPARNYNEIGGEFRMGNRWTSTFGITGGLTYCGIMNSAILLVGLEIGIRF